MRVLFGGWHRKFACADIVANPVLKQSKLKALNLDEGSKVASTKGKGLPDAKLPNSLDPSPLTTTNGNPASTECH